MCPTSELTIRGFARYDDMYILFLLIVSPVSPFCFSYTFCSNTGEILTPLFLTIPLLFFLLAEIWL